MKVDYYKAPATHLVPLIQQFADEVSEKSGEIDPGNEHDWRSLTLGWALAKGLPPHEAADFASFIRYSTNLG